LEARDRLPGAAHLRTLTRDRRQLLDRRIERLRVGLRVADAHVERDLRDPRHLHDRVELELVLELRAEPAVVELLQARGPGLGRSCSHQRSISWPQPSRLQTRTRTVSPFTSLSRTPTRRGSL